MHTLREQNKSVVRDWEAREWAKAKAKVQERVARAERMEAEGIPDPVREKSKALLAARKAREEAAAAHGCDEPAKEPAGHACRRKEASAGRAGGALPAKAAPLAQRNLMRPGGSNAMTIKEELKRWPHPPACAGCYGALVEHSWPLYFDHFDWLDEMASAYLFSDAGEVLRHLVYVANSEAPLVKKLIFKALPPADRSPSP